MLVTIHQREKNDDYGNDKGRVVSKKRHGIGPQRRSDELPGCHGVLKKPQVFGERILRGGGCDQHKPDGGDRAECSLDKSECKQQRQVLDKPHHEKDDAVAENAAFK